MNSIWNKNYSAFQNRFPQLSEILPPPDIALVSNPSFWKLEQTRNGMITASEEGLRLHSAYNPEREAAGGVSNEEIKEKSATVFYGFGLGYHVVEWCKLYNNTDATKVNVAPTKGPIAGPRAPKKLILIEPDVNHFYAALSVLDWTPVFQVENLVLAIGCPAESVLPLIEDTSKINIGGTGVSDAYFFAIPAFMAHAQEYFATVQSIINRNKRKNEINAATLKKFGKLWCRNSIRNIEKMRELGCVSDYVPSERLTSQGDLLPGVQSPSQAPARTPSDRPHTQAPARAPSDRPLTQVPFLLLGAGPSLAKILPHLSALKNRTIIICVETALRALLRQGVQPDFIIITDPQWWAYRHIAGLKAPESILVTEVSAYPAVFRFPCKKIILCSSQFPVGQYFQQKLGTDPGDLGTGGSVASSAWNMAHLLGAREIFTAGLDFAFPENKTHIPGSDAEETFLATGNRLAGPDKFVAGGLYNANAALGKDYKGRPVMTDSRMKMFGWWFESRLAKCPETKTYTLCPEGLNVPGITPAPVEELLHKKEITTEKAKFFQQVEGKPLVTGDKVPAFKKLLKEFPSKDFLTQFPFLKDYL